MQERLLHESYLAMKRKADVYAKALRLIRDTSDEPAVRVAARAALLWVDPAVEARLPTAR